MKSACMPIKDGRDKHDPHDGVYTTVQRMELHHCRVDATTDHVKQIKSNHRKVNVTFPLICGPQNSLEINKLYTKSAWVREHVCTHGDVYM